VPDSPFCLGHVAAQTASSRACAVDGMLLHASTGAAGSITPSQLSPIKGSRVRTRSDYTHARAGCRWSVGALSPWTWLARTSRNWPQWQDTMRPRGWNWAGR
jgi:hypothetical protein